MFFSKSFVLRRCFLSIFIFNFISPNSQTLTLRLHQIPNAGLIKKTSNEVVLGSYYGEKFNLVEAKQIGNDTIQEFVFKRPISNSTGLFELFIGDKTDSSINKAEFIWSESESLIMDAVFYQLKDGSVMIQKSIENEAYSQLNVLKNSFIPRLEELYQKRVELSVFDSSYKKKVLDIEIETEKLQIEYNLKLVQIANYYPNTYTSNTLVPLSRIPSRSVNESLFNEFDSYFSFLNKYFFHHSNFNDEGILYHYAFWDKIFYYFTNYTDKTTDGALYGIDVIMSQLKENQEVNDFVYNTLLKTFIKINSETLTKHLIESYGSSCALNLSFEELKRLQSITSITKGNVVPEISLPDKNGNYHSLRSFCQQKKYTILFVWVSWCSRCKKELPELVKIYQSLKNKGLGVYAVSLDEQKEDWINTVNKYGANWTNVAELVEIPKSQILSSYSISTTPALFILNDKGEMVEKNIFSNQLKKYLEENLKK